MSDLRFQKLTPTSNVNLNAYEEGFEFIFSNDDIRNIAVSGPYSSGKSSLLCIFRLNCALVPNQRINVPE